MVRVSPHKILDLPQTGGEWLRVAPARVIEKTEPGEPERPNFRPLFGVAFLGNLESAPHPPEIAPTFRALGRGLFWSLPRLTAFETGVWPEAIRTLMQGQRGDLGHLAITDCTADFHPL